ncbi:hypothetical protein [Streptomyces sp. NPDC048242]|uniref:hypothetical protein n=1 Tax=Streptomyces sp. NPDC048242 TaxID=3155026 RepID=UPI0034141EE5
MSGDETDDEATALGSVIDALGVTSTIEEGELVAAAVVLLKVIEEDGSTRLSICYSDGLGWIERAGMLRIAETLEAGAPQLRPSSDD